MYEESANFLDEGMFNVNENLTDDHLNAFNSELESTNLTNLTNVDKNIDELNNELNIPILEDNESNLNLLDNTLSEEDVFKYLSLFNENNFQPVDDLDIETGMQQCSSMNSNVSNATTVSTHETNQFSDTLPDSDLDKKVGDYLIDYNQIIDIYQNDESIANNTEQFDDKNLVIQNFNDTTQVNYWPINQAIDQANATDTYNSSTDHIVYDSTNTYNTNMNEINQINACQTIDQSIVNQMNDQINHQQNEFNSNQLTRINYYYPPSIDANQINQTNRFHYSNNLPDNVQQQQMSFMDNNLNMPVNNCNYINTSNNLIGLSTIDSTNNGQINNQNYLNYLNSTECRDTDCPYTFCSSYNPYYNNLMSTNNGQLRQFNENYLANKTVNMNAIDNQVVHNKPSNYVFDVASTCNQSQPTKPKRAKKTNKQQVRTETVICNESTDYTFFTLIEDNSQLKKKRGRKRKTQNILELG